MKPKKKKAQAVNAIAAVTSPLAASINKHTDIAAAQSPLAAGVNKLCRILAAGNKVQDGANLCHILAARDSISATGEHDNQRARARPLVGASTSTATSRWAALVVGEGAVEDIRHVVPMAEHLQRALQRCPYCGPSQAHEAASRRGAPPLSGGDNTRRRRGVWRGSQHGRGRRSLAARHEWRRWRGGPKNTRRQLG